MKKEPTPTEMAKYWKDLKEQIKDDYQKFKSRFPNFSFEEMLLYCDKMVLSIEQNIDCILSWKFDGTAKIVGKDEFGNFTELIDFKNE